MATNIAFIDSNERTSGTVQVAQYSLLNTGGVEGTYEILDFQSSDLMFNVELGVNDQLHWAEPGNLTATVPPGNYTQTTYGAAAKIVMDAASGSTFTFTQAADTGLVTVAIAAGTFNWEFGTTTAQSGRLLLGLSAVDTGAAASIVGDLVPDLRLHSHLLMNIAEDGNKNITLIDGSEFSAMIPLDGTFGADLSGKKLVNYQQSVLFSSNITTLNVSLATEDGTALVTANTPRYVLVLRKLF